MVIRYFVHPDGRYAGCAQGAVEDTPAPFAGLGEVPLPPPPGDVIWTGAKWSEVFPTAAEILAAMAPVSHAQMAAALAMSGIITDAEAIGWINGALPAKITSAITTLPEDHRLIATLRASRPSVVDPSDGIVAMLAAVEGKTEAEMVDLFQLAASL